MSEPVTVCSTDPGTLARVRSALRKLDFQAVDEAKQEPGVTYADTVRKVPVYDAVEQGLLRRPRFTPHSTEPDVVKELGELYPDVDGFTPHDDEYAALMARADELTGTTGESRWTVWQPVAMGVTAR